MPQLRTDNGRVTEAHDGTPITIEMSVNRLKQLKAIFGDRNSFMQILDKNKTSEITDRYGVPNGTIQMLREYWQVPSRTVRAPKTANGNEPFFSEEFIERLSARVAHHLAPIIKAAVEEALK